LFLGPIIVPQLIQIFCWYLNYFVHTIHSNYKGPYCSPFLLEQFLGSPLGVNSCIHP
ncbi:unnamed protein product, partial [Arabidopsis halleri]